MMKKLDTFLAATLVSSLAISGCADPLNEDMNTPVAHASPMPKSIAEMGSEVQKLDLKEEKRTAEDLALAFIDCVGTNWTEVHTYRTLIMGHFSAEDKEPNILAGTESVIYHDQEHEDEDEDESHIYIHETWKAAVDGHKKHYYYYRRNGVPTQHSDITKPITDESERERYRQALERTLKRCEEENAKSN